MQRGYHLAMGTATRAHAACNDPAPTHRASAADCGLDADGQPIDCVPFAGNCHDRPLVVTDENGNPVDSTPAGSPNACHAALETECTVPGDGALMCALGSDFGGVESCPAP